MFVSSINGFKKYPSFGKVVVNPSSVGYTSAQKKVADSIVNAMRTPMDSFNGKTAEEYYEAKGYNFEIYPELAKDRVSVDSYKNTESNWLTFHIGTYDNKKVHFSCDDLEKQVSYHEKNGPEFKQTSERDMKEITLGLLALLGLTTALTCVAERTNEDDSDLLQLGKPKIEVADTTAVNIPVETIDTISLKGAD